MFDPVLVEIKVARPLTGGMDGMVIRAIAEKVRARGWRYRVIGAVVGIGAAVPAHNQSVKGTVAMLIGAGVFFMIGTVIVHRAAALDMLADSLQHKAKV